MLQQLRRGFGVILVLVAHEAGRQAGDLIAEPLLQLLKSQPALEQQRGVPVAHYIGIPFGAARQ